MTSRPRIQSVARAARVLELVAGSARGLSAREISTTVGIRLPTTYHLLHTLTAVDLLRRDASEGRYVIGFAAAALAGALERQVWAPEQLHRSIRSAAAQTGEAVYGAGWSDGEIVVLARAPGSHPVSVAATPLGLLAHAHARASGKLLLAVASEPEREAYLTRHPPVAVTPRTLVGEALLADLRRVREQGYATDDEELAEGIACVAVAHVAGTASAALALSAPAERFRANADAFRRALQTAVTT